MKQASYLGSHAGGIKEVIRHEETGFIVDMRIVHKLQNMLLNFYQIQSYIKNAIQMLKDIEARFSSDLITDQYENYYRRC